MHVFIPELRLGGHHAKYLEQCIDALAPVCELISVSVQITEQNNLALAALVAKHKIVRVVHLSNSECERARNPRLGEVEREVRLHGIMRRAFMRADSRQKVDFVFAPYADYFLYAAAVFGSPFGAAPWAGICMRPSFHHEAAGLGPGRKLDSLKKILFSRLLQQSELKRLFTIDELMLQHVKGSEKLAFLPDPAEFTAHHSAIDARRKFGLRLDAKVVLVYGSITERKGLDKLVESLEKRLDTNLQLLVVGKHSGDFKRSGANSILARLVQHGVAVVQDEFVSEEMQELAMAAADAVWLGYRGHFAMSGVLVLAANAGKQVIASNQGLIGYYTRKFALGPVIDPADAREVQQALTQLESAAPPQTNLVSPFVNFSWANMRALVSSTADEVHPS